MIITQPFILAGEFIQHPILIVLAGIVLVEFLTRCKRREKRHDILILLAISLLTAGWLMSAYFTDVDQMWYQLFIHAPIVLTIIILLVQLARRRWVIVPHALFFILVSALSVHLLLDVFSMVVYMPYIDLMRTFFKIIEVGILYLFVMKYLIRTDDPQAL